MPTRAVKKFPPEECDGLQVNFCRQVDCPNFGIARQSNKDSEIPINREGKKVSYKFCGANVLPKLKCTNCCKTFRIKSNISIIRERDRIKAYYKHVNFISCPNIGCENHSNEVDLNPLLYQKFGYTQNNIPRIRCKICKKTFTNSKRDQNHIKSHQNFSILKHILSHTPINRICELESVSPKTIYDKIDYFEKQFLSFASSRECILPPMERLYVGCDQQHYTINWEKRHDKRNVILLAIATCDNVSGYCFGIHVNLDDRFSYNDIRQLSESEGDIKGSPPYRKYANYWLAEDYYERARKKNYKFEIDPEEESELSEIFSTTRLPYRGVQIHNEYTMSGHMCVLKEMFKNVEKVRFALDKDAGLRSACLTVFADRILDRTCDVFTISVDNEYTRDERERINRLSRKIINSIKQQRGLDNDHDAKKYLISRIFSVVNSRDILASNKVVRFPFSHNGELKKYAVFETNLNDYDIDHVANLFLKASIHRTNNFFQQVRRRINLLDRSINTAGERVWYGYNPYNPAIIQKMLNIFRIYHNYCLKGADKKTPAEKLGLAKGPVALEKILYCV